MSKFEGKNLAAIREAIDQHNASCPVPGNAILLNPVDHQLIGWDELWGLPVISDDRVPTKRVRIQCDGSAFGIEDEVAEAVAREQPIEVPVVVPVGPGEDDMPQFDERDLPQAQAPATGLSRRSAARRQAVVEQPNRVGSGRTCCRLHRC